MMKKETARKVSQVWIVKKEKKRFGNVVSAAWPMSFASYSTKSYLTGRLLSALYGPLLWFYTVRGLIYSCVGTVWAPRRNSAAA